MCSETPDPAENRTEENEIGWQEKSKINVGSSKRGEKSSILLELIFTAIRKIKGKLKSSFSTATSFRLSLSEKECHFQERALEVRSGS